MPGSPVILLVKTSNNINFRVRRNGGLHSDQNMPMTNMGKFKF